MGFKLLPGYKLESEGLVDSLVLCVHNTFERTILKSFKDSGVMSSMLRLAGKSLLSIAFFAVMLPRRRVNKQFSVCPTTGHFNHGFGCCPNSSAALCRQLALYYTCHILSKSNPNL